MVSTRFQRLAASAFFLGVGVQVTHAFSPTTTVPKIPVNCVRSTMSRPLSASTGRWIPDQHDGKPGDIKKLHSPTRPSQQRRRTGLSHSAMEWFNKNSRTLAVAVAAITATSVLMTPSAALAVDGSVTALADQTNSWISGLAETGFYQAFSLVFLSEIGDKTFFIAGLLAMKTNRLVSFLGSMAALAAMTVLSVLIGQIFHAVPTGFGEGIPFDDIAAAIAFAFFGVKTLLEALQMDENSSIMDEELAEAQETVDSSRTVKEISWVGQLVSIFTLVFAAEFGDRSFLSTIALSAAQNPVSVAGGAIAAHGVATGIAVGGGSVIAKYISEKVIGLIGGTLFIVFAITTVLGIF